MKKPWQQLLKESFTKSFDERYAEASKSERRVFWVSLVLVLGSMFLIWNSK